MPAAFRRILLIGKKGTPEIESSLSDLRDFLRKRGCEVLAEGETRADLAIVVGGDGTMLTAARDLVRHHVPLVGVNQGRLGFMTDIPQEGMLEVLSGILSGSYKAERRTLLEGRVVRAGETIHVGMAVNDVVVSRGTGAGMAELRVDVDGQFMYNQRSDGLIISTPTGSTAYALSAGGPLLHPSLGGIVLVPIAPHALSNRPIVLPESSEIIVEIVRGRDISVNFDMQTFASLQSQDQIVIQRSPHAITFLHPDGWSYYHTLREKLHWNEYPSGEGKLN